jgi:hypothetical protein
MDYRVDAEGVSISNPNGNAPIRVSWRHLSHALDCLRDWSQKSDHDLTQPLTDGWQAVNVACLRASNKTGGTHGSL